VSGRRISHYEIVAELGRGGSGIVYKARDTRLGRHVALKFLSPSRLASPEAVARFVHEARAISMLSHPNIAVLYDVGEVSGERYLVLEHLPGGTLRTRIRDLRQAGLRLSLEEIGRYALQVCAGLAHAHRHGIVHRDMKSGNVMFSGEGFAKITDFGLAKWWRSGELTSPGVILGTTAYMSPEQARGREADPRSDIFSLGVVLYEMAVGELPFHGAHEVAVLREVIETPTPAVAAVRADLPPGFGEIVARATAKSPEERYQSVEELADDLGVVCHASQAVIHVVRPDDVLTIPPRPPAPPPEPWWRRVLSRRLAIPAACALLALGLALPLRERLADWLLPWSLPERRVLAVLPFANLGEQETNQAFCDGLTESLTATLNQLEQVQKSLRVVPAGEVRGAKVSSAEEARRKFGVNLALGGSVLRDRGKVQVRLSLLDARRARVRASDDVSGFVADVAKLEESVFHRVAGMLRLDSQALKEPGYGRIAAPAAYDLYLQGRGHMHRYDVPESLDRAISAFQQALQQDPNYAPALAGLGEACCRKYRKTKDPQWIGEVKRSATRAAELNDRLAPACLALGLIHHDTGGYEEAVAQFQRALKLNPVDPATYRELARAYAAKGQHQEAVQAFQRAIDLWPDYWAGHSYLGDYCYRHGRDQDAERCFLRVIELEPDSELAYRNLGGIYYQMGRLDEAARMTQRSLDLRPTAQGCSNLGVMYQRMGRFAEAGRMFQQAVKKGSNDRRTWGNLAQSYRWASEPGGRTAEAYRQALQLAERDLAVNRRDAEVRAFLATYCLALSERERALREIGEAGRLAPRNKIVLFQSALVYDMSGRRERALEALRAAVQHGYSVAEVQWHPDLASLRQDPRYASVLASAGQ